MVIPRKLPGSRRPRADYYESVRRTALSQRLTVSPDKLHVSHGASGTVVAFSDPLAPRWCYLRAIRKNGELVATESRRGESGVSTSEDLIDALVGWPAPGITSESLAGLVVEQRQPTVLDTPLLYVGGMFTPFSASSAVVQLRISFIKEDYLVCRVWNGTSLSLGNALINVAKPYLLRKTPFHDQARGDVSYYYTSHQSALFRRATHISGLWEDQQIVPSYREQGLGTALGDVLYAAEVGMPTGIFEPGTPPTPITLLDLNVDGRAWARKNEEI